MNSPQNWPQALQLPAGEHRLCGCWQSPTWPHCPGKEAHCADRCHSIALNKARFVWICQCRQSQTLPFCDGEGHIAGAQGRTALQPD